MYRREHYQKINHILEMLDADLLKKSKCYFGGGTAISLMLNEYRESVDIDFLCADQEGYKALREKIFDCGLKGLFTKDIEVGREIKSDQYGIRARILVDNVPIKFEIVKESRIELAGQEYPGIPVVCLTKNDLFSEKLLANDDRCLDKHSHSRDIIDLMMMQSVWGDMPSSSIEKSIGAYGKSVMVKYEIAKNLIKTNPQYLEECLTLMKVEAENSNKIKAMLGIKEESNLNFHPKSFK